jgi:hypothetical protein
MEGHVSTESNTRGCHAYSPPGLTDVFSFIEVNEVRSSQLQSRQHQRYTTTRMNASTRDGTGQSSAGVFSSAATSVQQSQPAEAQPTKKITSRRQLQAQEATSASARRNVPDRSPCTLFAITQFECTATDRVRCWPIERIFRQCVWLCREGCGLLTGFVDAPVAPRWKSRTASSTLVTMARTGGR